MIETPADAIPEAPPIDRPLDVITLGRAAVDLYGEQIGGRLEDMTSFAKYIGGCPANIAVGAARLGLKTAMLTRVGDEQMGRFVRETLAAEGVDVSRVKIDPERLTGLVLLGIRDRDTFPLLFYRENCADMAITASDIDADFVGSARALVVTGTHFSTPTTDAASRAAMVYARTAGTRVVLDIDYRPVLWGLTGRGRGEDRFIASETVSAHLQAIVPLCDLIAGTEEEIHIAGGTTDTVAALRRLREISPAVLVVKLGPQGCIVLPGPIPARLEDGILVSGFPVEVFNVLGAGDAFMAGLLCGWLGGRSWRESCRMANACGALVVSRHGCAPAMPSRIELREFLDRAESAGGVPRALHADAPTAERHRVTTRRWDRSRIMMLALDNRSQFEELAEPHPDGAQRIARFKSLVAMAFLEVGKTIDGAGIVLDDRYGRDPLFAVTGQGLWVARSIERAGATPVAFEHGSDIFMTLRSWPAEHIVKVLVYCRPDQSPALRATQEERMATLFKACTATGHDLLLELVLPGIAIVEVVEALAESMTHFYAAGVRPDWWGLPPLAFADDWRRLGDVIRAHDPGCRGILTLGQDTIGEAFGRVLSQAASEPLVRGFVIGRSIVLPTARQWFSGEIGDAAVGDAVIAGFREAVARWNALRPGGGNS